MGVSRQKVLYLQRFLGLLVDTLGGIRTLGKGGSDLSISSISP